MQRFSSFLISMVMVVFALSAGAMLTDFTHTFIRFILPLPSVDLAREDFILTGTYLISSSFVVFLAMALLIPTKLFSSPERTAKQVYGWGAAWGSGSLALYLASSSVFPHHLLVGAGLSGILFLCVGFALFGASRDGEAVTTPLKRLTAVLGATFGLLRKPLSWLAILVTLAPLITAVAYVKSQVFRDTVVEFRIQQNVSVEGDWTTVAVNTKTQLLQPIMIRVVPKKTDQMLVLERAGRLYRIGYPDTGTKDLLVDFSGEVGEVNLENGAMGFDFNPRFGEDGYNFVYVYFTSYTPELQTNYLARFDLSAGDPEAVLASRMNLIELERPPSQYHNGGHVEIGSDNMLYLSIGELDLPDFHQTIDKTLAGGVLRIDVLNQGGDVSRDITQQPVNGKTQGYSIPLDNPFIDSENALGEFYAFGLRNPFRFAFDSETDMIWTGDVGSTVWEEVNVVEKGGNYQFPFIEGREKTTTPPPDVVVGNEKEPIYT
jgi:glucose/arabinose dehydrogenase